MLCGISLPPLAPTRRFTNYAVAKSGLTEQYWSSLWSRLGISPHRGIMSEYQPGDEMASTGEARLGLQAEAPGPR